MGVMESIKKGFSVTFRNLPLVALLFVFGAIWNLAQLKLAPAAPVGTAPAPPSPVAIAAGLAFVLISIFVQGGTLGFIRDAVKQGGANFSVFTQSGGKYYLRLLLAGLFIGVIVGVFVLGAVLAVSYLTQAQAAIGVVIAAILGAIGIYVVLLMFLTPYIIVAEDAGVMVSIKKSITMVKHNILKVLGLTLLLVAVGFLAGLLIGVLIGVASAAGPASVVKLVTALAGSAVNAILGVLVTASFMTLYFGLPQE